MLERDEEMHVMTGGFLRRLSRNAIVTTMISLFSTSTLLA